MKSGTSVPADEPARGTQDFSLALGGPLFQLLRREHLAADGLLLLRKRVLIISLFPGFPS